MSTGKIESVHLRNFKCHSVLDFKLNSNINFIIGKNGSGKSAIMDAIMLCLGGSNDTASQAKASSFIKTNENQAELRVSLINEGNEAYKPLVYGKKISIKRTIYSKGYSKYKVLNEYNKVVSIKKEEIYSIAEHFNIQVFNPVCFLNQEVSKDFFRKEDSNSKYELFLQASQLDSLKRFQDKINKERESSLAIIKDKESQLLLLQDELYELEQMVKKFSSIDKLRRQLSVLNQEMIWAYIYNDEKEFKLLKQSLDSQLKQKETVQNELNGLQVELDLLHEKENTLNASLNEFRSKLSAPKEKFQTINRDRIQESVQQRMIINETKKLSLRFEKKRRERDELKHKLNTHSDQINAGYRMLNEEKTIKIQSIEEDIAAKTTSKTSLFQRIQLVNLSIDTYESQLDERKFELRECEKMITNLQSDLVDLKSSNRNQVCRFGKQIASLIDAINLNETKFEIKPIGPIGLHVQPKDEKYSLAIEQCISSLLYSFVCSSHQDEKVLHQLISKIYGKSKHKVKVIVTCFSTPLYDVSLFRPEYREYPTVFEMLNIKNKVIANVLIDMRRIESVLLLPDYETARKIIEFGCTRKVKEGFTPNGDQFIGQPSYRVYASTSNEKRIFTSDIENVICSKELEILNLKQHLPAIKISIENMTSELISNKKQKFQLDVEYIKLNDDLFSLKSELEYFKKIKNETKPTYLYEEEFNNLETEIKEIKNQIKVNQRLIHLKNESNKQRTELEFEIQSSETKIVEIEKHLAQLQLSRMQFQEEISNLNKSLVELSASVEKKNKEIVQNELKLEKSLKSVSKFKRVETTRSVESILNQIEVIEEQIRINEKIRDQEEITNNYLSKRNKYKDLILMIKKQKEFLRKLEQALSIRDSKLAELVKSKSLRCAADFNKLMFKQNFVGNLLFDHNEKKLKIDVKPNIAKSVNTSKEMVSLSGGERSYSKVAFLLSLWSIVESPVFFLDEFDVFMDESNRHNVLQLLISSAKKNVFMQYVFMSPLDTRAVKIDQALRIFKMPDGAKRAIENEKVESNERQSKRLKFTNLKRGNERD